jgi:hypothetical protein
MASIGELKQRYDELDPVSRQNLWFLIIGLLLLIILAVSLSNTASTVGSFFGKGAKSVSDNVDAVQRLRN